jgi:hypothetical protein
LSAKVGAQCKFAARNNCLLQRDQRSWQACLGAIEKEAHAEGFGTLHCDKAHLPADVIAVFEPRDLSLVVIGIALQASDAIF